MSTTPQASDIFNDQRMQSYGMLKTLTVLTFIGCALAYISIFYTMATWGNYENQLVEAQQMEEEMSRTEIGSKLMQGTVEMIEKSHEHRYLLAGTGLLFTTLCLIGAMRMRKLKKGGYPIYVIGELAPLAVTAFVLGFNFFNGIVMALTAVFALLFVILYTTQRKYLVND